MRAALLVLLLSAPRPRNAGSEFDRAKTETYELVTASYLEDGVCSRQSVSISKCGSFTAISDSDGYRTQSKWFDARGALIGTETHGCGVTEKDGTVPSCDEELIATEDVCAIVRERMKRVGVTLHIGDESLRTVMRFDRTAMKFELEGAVFVVRFGADPRTEPFLEVREVAPTARLTRGEVIGSDSYALEAGDQVSLPVELLKDGKLAARVFVRSNFALEGQK